jgi:hypothetical protein
MLCNVPQRTKPSGKRNEGEGKASPASGPLGASGKSGLARLRIYAGRKFRSAIRTSAIAAATGWKKVFEPNAAAKSIERIA